MAILSRFRLTSLQRRYFSSILSPDSTSPLSSKKKTRAALSLLKTEKNPERIIDICRAASLTPSSSLDRVAFSVAISKLTKYNYFEGIRLFLEELKTRPDLKNERFLSHAIILYGQAGMLDHAIRTFETMHEMGVDRTVGSLNALLLSCTFAKKHGEVKRIFVEFPERYGLKPDVDTYNTVIRAFCESGSSSSGYSIFAEMERNGCKPNATSFGTLISGFYEEEKYDDVGKVLEMMKNCGIDTKVSTYNIRIKSLCKLKKSVEAKALLDGMLSRGMKPNSVTYCHLIHGFCKEGNLDEAKKLFKRMKNSGCKPDSECYFTLVFFLCQGGDFVTALEICRESLQKNWVPNFSTMKLLVNGLASISKVDEARELVRLMREKFSSFANQWDEVEEGLPK